jgi:hypothetical protein
VPALRAAASVSGNRREKGLEAAITLPVQEAAEASS